MKILWITNTTFPEALAFLNNDSEIKGSGGWLTSMAELLIEKDDIELHVASITGYVHENTLINGERIRYHLIPSINGDNDYNKNYEEQFQRIVDLIKPDVVHIHGTEYPHSLAALRASGTDRSVVSLQGLVSIIARYNNGGISKWLALKNITLHDIVRGGIIRQQLKMARNGCFEVQLLKEAKFVIGRTSFDKEHVWAINPTAKYFHCDEILRPEFYISRKWDYDKCVPHSIFLSQSAFPIKGLHKVVEALDIVIKHYPDVQLRVAGRNLTWSNGTWMDQLRLTGYGKIVKKMINEKGLEKKIIFTGSLNAEGMIKEYLNANLFICASSIENSPNSLAEAQILGVPCLGSYAGGIPDMLIDEEQNLYRFDDIEMLSYKICDTFSKQNQIDTSKMRELAFNRHDATQNIINLINIYRIIIDKGERKK